MNIMHQFALESEKIAYEDGIWICSNLIFGILFMNSHEEFVFNKALCMQGGF